VRRLAGGAAFLALSLLAGCTNPSEDCPGTSECRWGGCTGRRFRSCGPCPGGSVDTRRCGAGPRLDAGTDAPEATCANTPCFPPRRCLSGCEGAVQYQGCCPCPEGTVDALTCPPRDASGDGDPED
jgi:hypothetical protein